MRTMLYLPYVGMPNILAGERLVPELLQDEATPAALAAALVALLRDKRGARAPGASASTSSTHLLRQNTAEKAADAVLESAGRTPCASVRRVRRGRGRARARSPGPVYAAAVILDPARRINGLADSKVLQRRAPRAARRAHQGARARLGGRRARASRRSTASTSSTPPCSPCAARSRRSASRPRRPGSTATHCPGPRLPRRAIVDGDALHPVDLGGLDPRQDRARRRDVRACTRAIRDYGFDRHKGYSTAEHLDALARLGPCEIHRRSFEPVRRVLPEGSVQRGRRLRGGRVPEPSPRTQLDLACTAPDGRR